MRRLILPAALMIFLCLPHIAGGEALELVSGGSNESGATLLNPGEVLLKWTAPGDDGYSGRASSYELRYQLRAKGPLDTELEWIQGVRVIGEPTPSAAGRTDSILLTGLPYGERYYFCIRAYDEVGNASPLSNSPMVMVQDSFNCSYLPGDVNGNGVVNMLDVSYLITFIYKDGPAAIPAVAGDVDGSLSVNILDVSYLTRYLYRDGDKPVCRD